MLALPDLMDYYLEYCKFRQLGHNDGRIDLTKCEFIHPTTLIPLLADTEKKGWIWLTDPNNPVGGYLDYILGSGKTSESGKSYISPVRLPKKQAESEKVLSSLYQLESKSHLFSKGEGTDGYRYVISELTDNIYDHSEFENAFVMAQKYALTGYIELCFYDDGITIPGSYQKCGTSYPPKTHHKAILSAIQGVSTKADVGRGFGLSSNVEVFRNIGGEILIVSGHGAIFVDKGGIIPFQLGDDRAMNGTLISIRVLDGRQNLKLYQYLES